MSDRGARKGMPSEGMRDMLDKMAYLALCYAIQGQSKQAEGMRKTARQVRRTMMDNPLEDDASESVSGER